jgi:hypothetical protein
MNIKYNLYYIKIILMNKLYNFKDTINNLSYATKC